LSALTDSFGREAVHASARSGADLSALEVAYATRWIELAAGRELRDWLILCRSARL